jgi:hypothetical protein
MQLNDEIKKNNPFKVPEGYFDTLTERTMSAIRTSGEEADAVKEKEKPARRVRMMPFLALAAAIIGFALVTTVVVRVVSGDRGAPGYETGNGLYADLAAEELDTYLIERELIETEEVEMTGTGQTIPSEIIIDYLMTEDIDLNDIYELL